MSVEESMSKLRKTGEGGKGERERKNKGEENKRKGREKTREIKEGKG